MTIKILDKKNCCGCYACYNICPKSCIEMVDDNEGFKYPVIINDKCIKCDLCKKVCPIINVRNNNSSNISAKAVYAAFNKNDYERENSSSGGIFYIFAKYVLDLGGIVCGCTLSDNNSVEHIIIDKKDDILKLTGSKYVQSSINSTFIGIEESLSNNKKVLFVGTPCQTAALNSYLKYKDIDYSNLITIDFICHGVPSHKIFTDYVKYLEKKYDSKITSFKFRNKDKGWNQSGLQLGTKITFKNGQIVRNYPAYKDKYMNGFLSDICLRPSCYDCKFKEMPKEYSDITIGDFWGIDKIDKKMNDNKGTSIVILNTEKSLNIWNLLKSKFEYKEVDYINSIRKNKTLIESVTYTNKRSIFFNEYLEKGFEYDSKKYMNIQSWLIKKAENVILK